MGPVALAAAAALTFAAPVTLPGGSVVDAELPAPPVVAVGARGDALVQWQSLSGSRVALLRRGRATRVLAAGSGHAAAAAVAGDGDALVAFDGDDEGAVVPPFLVLVAHADATPRTIPLGGDAWDVRVAARPAGGFLVLTAAAGGGCAGLRSRSIAADGEPSAPAVLPGSGRGTRGAPAIAFAAAPDGRAIIACSDGSAADALWTVTPSGRVLPRAVATGLRIGTVAAGGAALLWTARDRGGHATRHILRKGTDHRSRIRSAADGWRLDGRGRPFLTPHPAAAWGSGAVAAWATGGRLAVATRDTHGFRRVAAPPGRPERVAIAAAGRTVALAWVDRNRAVRVALGR